MSVRTAVARLSSVVALSPVLKCVRIDSSA
jgi:hypothetical protein